MPREYLTTSDVASLFSVHPNTVVKWANSGLLRCVRTAGRHRRYLREDVDRLLAKTRTPNEAA